MGADIFSGEDAGDHDGVALTPQRLQRANDLPHPIQYLMGDELSAVIAGPSLGELGLLLLVVIVLHAMIVTRERQ